MSTFVSDFDYELPRKLIAQHSVEPRDHSRLMVVDRQTGEWQHKQFYQIVDELRAGDVLVMNNTKVFRARLKATVQSVLLRASRGRERSVAGGHHSIELFLLRPRQGAWDVLVKPGRHVTVGDVIRVGDIEGEVLSKSDVASVRFNVSDQELIDYANEHGAIPIPPYVHEVPDSLDKYQTVYAQETGSVAAPTAGFHFTDALLKKIQVMGVEILYVTLHVGLGTFRPMKSQTIEEHQMHSEFVAVGEQAAAAITRAKEEGRRVIAVGTTTVRTLEGVAKKLDTKFLTCEKKYPFSVLPVEGFSGEVNLFVTPGFEFKIVDALITNFHLPKSTLLVLVSAFAGRESILSAYHEAVAQHYRFFSFGDAMFIR
jgi:S-adenosylmethionine:tRNA ribosyltransferase-isomerase